MKTIRRRLGCLLLSAVLLLSMIPAVFAAPTPGLSNFKRVNTYTAGTFSDVPEGEWYTPSIKAAYEYGLAMGSYGKFDRISNMTAATAITLAARLHAIYHTGSTAALVQGEPWYQVYVDYALANGIITAGQFTDYNATVTRAQCAVLLSKAIPASELPAINTVEDGAIPDVSANAAYYEDIYRLYRAGILTGNDAKGTFTPDKPIDRTAFFTIATRLMDKTLRKSLLLTQEYSGTCGQNVTWHFKDGTLTISGNGRMDSYGESATQRPPWVTETKNKVVRNLKKIVIEDGITQIGSYAFYDCSKVSEVYIPDSVTEIGSYALSGCSGLTSVTIPDSVTKIYYAAFSGCNGLTSVTIPKSVTTIDAYAFYECSSLTSVTIPDSVTYLGGFSGCTGLTSVTIPDSVIEIGGYAFENCTGLTSVTIPDSVIEISDSAFKGCTSLTSVTIPDSVTYLGGFNGCTGLTSVTIPNNVTKIGNNAFSNCSGLTSVTIPDSVTTIDDYAFYNCRSLTSVTIPSSVTTIGENAFWDCFSLTSVIIPDSVTEIAGRCFENCTNLTSITIPNSVTKIGGRAFANCFNLTSVTIPDSVTEIGICAFYECSSLTSVTIPDSVTTIGRSAFAYCNKQLTIRYYSSPYMDEYVTANPNLKFELIE